MNIRLLAEALRLAANALETPADETLGTSAQVAPVSPPATTQAAPTEAPAKRKPGRPAKGEDAAPTATAAPVSSATAQPATAASPAPSSGPLTTAIVAKDFTEAAAKHGVAFVKGLLSQYAKGTTFDTVPAELLPKMQAALRAGPQAAVAETAEDLLG